MDVKKVLKQQHNIHYQKFSIMHASFVSPQPSIYTVCHDMLIIPEKRHKKPKIKTKTRNTSGQDT